MTITVDMSTPTGTYPITVTGNGGGIQQNTTVTLTVTQYVPPDFTIALSPSSVTVQQGFAGSSTVTTTILGNFNSPVDLSASGMPTGMTVSFNPQTIPAPGAGTSAMTITVGSNTPLGTYPITVTGNGGGNQHSATLNLIVTSWAQGFDFRNTSTFVTDPSSFNYVLPGTTYPTIVNGVTFGWTTPDLVQGDDRSTVVDPRLAGINSAQNGAPATFYVDLPSPGTYNLALAMGDDGRGAMRDPVPSAVLRWQHGSGYGDRRTHQPGLLLRRYGEQLVGRGLADQQPQPAGDAGGQPADRGGGNQQRHR